MLELILGFILGVIFATLFVVVLAYFRSGIEKHIKVIETKLVSANPQTRGAIHLPEDEADIARREHIRKNAEQGKDTPLSELL